MENNDPFYTKTMAGVYAGQGHYENAARIYRHLLEKDPDKEDIRMLYEDMLDKIAVNRTESKAKLGRLIEEWLDLLVRQKNLKQLKSKMDTITTRSRRR